MGSKGSSNIAANKLMVEFTNLPAQGKRIDTALSEQLRLNQKYAALTRSQVQILIEGGHIWRDGTKIKKGGEKVFNGQEIEVQFSNFASSSELEFYDFELPILHEDDHIIVIDKPAGITVHPGAGNRNRTLVNALAAHFAKQGTKLPETFGSKGSVSAGLRPGIVHRLDKDTSGVIVVAKTLLSHQKLAEQFQKRTVRKRYSAIVFLAARCRSPIKSEDHGFIESGIARNPRNRKQFSAVDKTGKHAVTEWRVIERLPYAANLEVELHTGRTHQIRVHLAHIRAPIIGDPTYGNFAAMPAAVAEAHKELGRQALHACLLEFTHPDSGKKITFHSRLPEDIQALLKKLKKVAC